MKTTAASRLAPRRKPSIVLSAIALAASLGPAASFACTHTQAIGPATAAQREAVASGSADAPIVSTVPAGHNVGIYEWSNDQQAYVLTISWHDPHIIGVPPQWDETDVTDVLSGGAGMSLNSNCDPSRLEEITVTAVTNSNWRSSGIIAFLLRPARGAGGSVRRLIKPQIQAGQAQIPDTDCPATADDRAHSKACAAISAANNGNRPARGMVWHVTYRDGRKREWVGTNTTVCVEPAWSNGDDPGCFQ